MFTKNRQDLGHTKMPQKQTNGHYMPNCPIFSEMVLSVHADNDIGTFPTFCRFFAHQMIYLFPGYIYIPKWAKQLNTDSSVKKHESIWICLTEKH